MEWLAKLIDDNMDMLDIVRKDFPIGSIDTNDIRKNYKNDSINKNISEKLWEIITTESMALLREVVFKGGTKEEIKLALTYLGVCSDALNYNLDWSRWGDENGIVELLEKYHIKYRTEGMDI